MRGDNERELIKTPRIKREEELRIKNLGDGGRSEDQ